VSSHKYAEKASCSESTQLRAHLVPFGINPFLAAGALQVHCELSEEFPMNLLKDTHDEAFVITGAPHAFHTTNVLFI
jgi:hypothetical protein